MVEFDNLLNLLGKGEDDAEVKAVLTDLGKPLNDFTVRKERSRIFAEHGVSLNYSMKFEQFTVLICHLLTASVQEGSVKPFSGSLFGGILATDQPDDVQAKLGYSPYYSANSVYESCGEKCELESELWQRFRVQVGACPNGELALVFSQQHQLAMLSVSVSPGHLLTT